MPRGFPKDEKQNSGWFKKDSKINLGRKHTQETKNKISVANKGNRYNLGKHWKNSKEFKNKIRLRMLGNKIMLGRKLSEEHRKRISLSNKGKKHSKETRRKIGLAHIGRKLTKEHKRKLSIAKLGKPSNRKLPLNLLKKKDKRNDPAYQGWVRIIKKRDKVCKLKNEDCDGYKVVHHIKPWRDYPELRYELLNGITLCQFHHPRKRADEQRLIPVFTKLVGLNVY